MSEPKYRPDPEGWYIARVELRKDAAQEWADRARGMGMFKSVRTYERIMSVCGAQAPVWVCLVEPKETP